MSRLDDLLVGYEADALDDAERDELVALLGDAANRARLVELTRIAAALSRPDALPLVAARPRRARVATLALAAAAALAIAVRVAWPAPAARVRSVSDATVGGAAAVVGMRVADGAALAVGGGGALALRLADGSELRFGDGARATLGERASLVALTRGALAASVAHRPADRPLRVRTALAEATVLGTELTVAAGADATRVEVAQGRVRVTAAGDETIVEAGHAVEIERDAAARLVVAGVTRYVAIGDPRADDANDGAEARPWRSLARALRDLRPGDRVLVKRGVYRESAELHANGAVDAPIALAAYPGDEGAVVISGCDPRDDAVALGGGRFALAWPRPLAAGYPANWPRPGDPLAEHVELVFADGERLAEVASPDALSPGGFWVDDAGARIVIATRDGAAPRALEAATRQRGLTIAGDHLRVAGLVVAGIADAYGVGALQIDGDDIDLIDCVERDAAVDGIRATGRVRVVGCRADGNGRYGIAASVSDSAFIGDATDRNGWKLGLDDCGGLYLGGGAPERTRIVAHRAADNRGRGIRLVWDCRDCAIERCIVAGNAIAGIEIAACVGPNRIVGNVASGTRAWRGNRYEHATGVGILLREAGSVLIAHNTLIANERYGVLLSGGLRDNGARTIDCRIVGNLFARNGAAGIATWLWTGSDGAALRTHVIDRNLYWQPGAAVAQHGDATLAALADWRAAFGADAASLVADPRLRDAVGRIGSDSPAVAAGPDGVGGVDIDGTPRPAVHADIGAFQHAP